MTLLIIFGMSLKMAGENW